MRNKIILFLIITLLTTSSLAFAANETLQAPIREKKSLQGDNKARSEQRENLRAEMKAKLQQKQEKIQAQRQQEIELNKKVKVKVNEVQKQVKSLQKKHTLTPEKLAVIKEGLGKVKTDMNSLRQTVGIVNSEMKNFKENIRNRDMGSAKGNLDSVIHIQQQRINLLKSILVNLNSLQEALK